LEREKAASGNGLQPYHLLQHAEPVYDTMPPSALTGLEEEQVARTTTYRNGYATSLRDIKRGVRRCGQTGAASQIEHHPQRTTIGTSNCQEHIVFLSLVRWVHVLLWCGLQETSGHNPLVSATTQAAQAQAEKT